MKQPTAGNRGALAHCFFGAIDLEACFFADLTHITASINDSYVKAEEAAPYA